MRVLSLFDGMSCGRYCLESLGFKIDTYYASEIDKYAIEVSNNNFRDSIHLGDVNGWREWEIDFSSIDLIIAGSPCQSFSIAGNKSGFEGSSGVINVFFDILDHIRGLNPRVKFLLENVKMKKEWEDAISKRVGVSPLFLDSELFSAQTRKRLYWFNWDAPIFIPNGSDRNLQSVIEDDGLAYLNKSQCLTARYSGAVAWNSLLRSQRTMVATKRFCSENDPNRVEVIGGYSTLRGERVKVNLEDGVYYFRKFTPKECERLQGLPDGYSEGVSNSQRYKMIGNGWQCDTIKFILGGMIV